jgi:hypothetical protein
VCLGFWYMGSVLPLTNGDVFRKNPKSSYGVWVVLSSVDSIDLSFFKMQ